MYNFKNPGKLLITEDHATKSIVQLKDLVCYLVDTSLRKQWHSQDNQKYNNYSTVWE